MKICCHCKQIKSLDEFGRDANTKDKLKKTCKICLSVSYKKYHNEHPDKAQERQRRWREIPENKIKACEKVKRYYWKNVEICRLKSNLMKKTLLGKARVLRYNNTRRDRTLKQRNDLSKQDIQFLLEFQENKCAMCNKSFSKIPYTVDHVLPLSKGGGLTIQNAQLLCRPCNSRKGVKAMRFIPSLPFGG